jgi:HTH-type transcriptional regulator, competence development regulator
MPAGECTGDEIVARHLVICFEEHAKILRKIAFNNYVYYIEHMTQFGEYIRAAREDLRRDDRSFSLRQVAGRIKVEPAYLSKIERGDVSPPSEATTVRLATELGEDPDVLLAMAGKVSSDLQKIIRKRPKLFADLIRQLKKSPDHAILKVVREVRDGDW